MRLPVLTQENIIQLVRTPADIVFCTACIFPHGHAFIPWSPDTPCAECGRTNPYEGYGFDEVLALKQVRQRSVQPSPYLP